MTLEQINIVFQMLASIAVVVSIVYLAIQTRQAAHNARAAIHESRAGAIVGHIEHMIDPEFYPIWVKGNRAASDITDDEIGRYTLFVAGLVVVWEERFRQRQESMLDESRWTTSEDTIAVFASAPGFRAAIASLRRRPDTDFNALLNMHMAQGRAALPGAGAAGWRAAATQELAAMASAPASQSSADARA